VRWISPVLSFAVISAGRRASDRQRAARRRLALHEAEKHFGPVMGTGLAKVCGRCDRVGWTFERIGDGFVVVWDGPGHRADRPDMSLLSERDLRNPDFGCHYCHPVASATAPAPRVVGGAPPERDAGSL